jgi:hypothetical protein
MPAEDTQEPRIMIDTDATTIAMPVIPPGIADLIAELKTRERLEWSAISDAIPSWHPRLEGDGDDDDADDDDDDDKKKKKAAADDDDDDDKKKKAAADDDDDELERARQAAAAANRELKKIKAKAAADDAAAKKEAGKYKELYDEAQAELDKLKGEVTTSAKTRLAEAALTAAKAKNPTRAVKMLDLEEIEDQADAERAVRRLIKSDEYLFNVAKSRQKKGSPNDTDDDDDDDKKKPKRPVNRLRRGLEATSPK